MQIDGFSQTGGMCLVYDHSLMLIIGLKEAENLIVQNRTTHPVNSILPIIFIN